jgi:hypothetical protein
MCDSLYGILLFSLFILSAMAGLGGRQRGGRGGGKGQSFGELSGKGQRRPHAEFEDDEWEDMSSSDDDDDDRGLAGDFEDFDEDMQDKIAKTMAALNAFGNMTPEEGFDISRLKKGGASKGGGSGSKNKSKSGSRSSSGGGGSASQPLEVGDDVVVVPTGTKGVVRFLGPVHYAKVIAEQFLLYFSYSF